MIVQVGKCAILNEWTNDWDTFTFFSQHETSLLLRIDNTIHNIRHSNDLFVLERTSHDLPANRLTSEQFGIIYSAHDVSWILVCRVEISRELHLHALSKALSTGL